MYCVSMYLHTGSPGNSIIIVRIIGYLVSAVLHAFSYRYGIKLHFSLVKKRNTATASSSNTQGTLIDLLPCSRLWEESIPNATHLLYTSGVAVFSKPPMSWLQKPKPDMHNDNPPLKFSAMDRYVAQQSPAQWTGYFWQPAVAERANSTACSFPFSSANNSYTVLLYRYA